MALISMTHMRGKIERKKKKEKKKKSNQYGAAEWYMNAKINTVLIIIVCLYLIDYL